MRVPGRVLLRQVPRLPVVVGARVAPRSRRSRSRPTCRASRGHQADTAASGAEETKGGGGGAALWWGPPAPSYRAPAAHARTIQASAATDREG